MKNIILGMVFLLGMSITVNAKTIITDPVSDCIDQSRTDYAFFMMASGGDEDFAFRVSEMLLSRCLAEDAGIN